MKKDMLQVLGKGYSGIKRNGEEGIKVDKSESLLGELRCYQIAIDMEFY